MALMREIPDFLSKVEAIVKGTLSLLNREVVNTKTGPNDCF